MRVDFYHLTRAPAEGVLPAIAERLMDGKARLLIVSGDAEQLNRVDQALWSYRATSFLPHGLASAEGAADQPILLSTEATALNEAANIAVIDGVWRDSALAAERVFFMFSVGEIDDARTAWRALGDKDGVERHYWKQDEDGKWREGP